MIVYIISGIVLLCGSMPLTAQNYARTENGILYVPVLDSSPSTASEGTMYINRVDKKLYWKLNNSTSQWVTVSSIDIETDIVDISSTTGRVWMDRNLGAERVAASVDDYLAYGSFFQWCRAADGHQKVIWWSRSAGTPVYGISSTLSVSTTAPNSLFIINDGSWLNVSLTDGSLWWNGTVAGANNPCPTGYHVPTYAEWNAEIAAGISNATAAYSKLKLTAAGIRRYDNGKLDQSLNGYYWSSTGSQNKANMLNFDGSKARMQSNYMAFGFSVRCIKN